MLSTTEFSAPCSMKVVIDDKSGFCAGVVRAISEAERALEQGGEVFCLGDIVHNRVEVQRLESLGLKTIGHSDLERLSDCRRQAFFNLFSKSDQFFVNLITFQTGQSLQFKI